MSDNNADQRVSNAVLGHHLNEIEKTLCRVEGKLDAQGQQLQQTSVWIGRHEVQAATLEKRQNEVDVEIKDFKKGVKDMQDLILKWNWGNSFATMSALIAGFYAIFGIGK